MLPLHTGWIAVGATSGASNLRTESWDGRPKRISPARRGGQGGAGQKVKANSDTDTAVGFLVVSLLDKSHLQQAFSRSSWGDDASSGRARVVLFLGVALMAGGLAGSLVSFLWPLRRLLRGRTPS